MREAENLLDRVISMLGLKQADDADGLRESGQSPAKLGQKIQEIQRRAQRMQQNGEDVSKIQGLMQKVAPLIQQGKPEDAERLIDEALRLTGGKSAPASEPEKKGKANRSQEGNQSRRSPQNAIREELSPRAILNEFATLRQEDVAWRQIAWKTCLLDGLQASRDQHKPVMLWVFIDRPIDDQRC